MSPTPLQIETFFYLSKLIELVSPSHTSFISYQSSTSMTSRLILDFFLHSSIFLYDIKWQFISNDDVCCWQVLHLIKFQPFPAFHFRFNLFNFTSFIQLSLLLLNLSNEMTCLHFLYLFLCLFINILSLLTNFTSMMINEAEIKWNSKNLKQLVFIVLCYVFESLGNFSRVLVVCCF